MKKATIATLIIAVVSFTAVQAGAHASYTGYSGAPGSRGQCAFMCHPQHDFSSTIAVTGFPAAYVAGQTYTIAVAHNGGSAIKQFNASVRFGTGSNNAGVIAAGTNTATYDQSQETNGVHFTSSDQNSGTFLWTAPASGSGEARLYWAGLQGNLTTGADTQVVLISVEQQTGTDDPKLPNSMSLAQNYPNPFNSRTVIEFSLSQPGVAQLEISNILGQRVYAWSQEFSQPGDIFVQWNGKNDYGNDVPSGVYFYRLHTSQGDLTRKMILLR